MKVKEKEKEQPPVEKNAAGDVARAVSRAVGAAGNAVEAADNAVEAANKAENATFAVVDAVVEQQRQQTTTKQVKAAEKRIRKIRGKQYRTGLNNRVDER